MKLISPFPKWAIPDTYRWFASPAFVNNRNTPEGEYHKYLSRLLDRAWSWGLEDEGGLCGMVTFEPIQYPGQDTIQDGYVTFALARRVWGKRVPEEWGPKIMGILFASIRTLRRVTGYTLETNTPAQRVAERLGCQQEGILRQAWNNQSVVIYGLLREDVEKN